MTRKERRSQISEFILHSKSFIKDKKQLQEEQLDDGSVKFYIEGFASTEVQDGSGDIVKVDGIDTTRYEMNPVLQRGHKRGSENTIGKITKIEKVAGKGLWIGADVILNPSIEDHKPIIHGLRHGLINGFSIGFKEVQARYDDMQGANIIEKLELFEISLVDIPDNPLTVRKFIDKVISKQNKEETSFNSETETMSNQEIVVESQESVSADQEVIENNEEIVTNIEETQVVPDQEINTEEQNIEDEQIQATSEEIVESETENTEQVENSEDFSTDGEQPVEEAEEINTNDEDKDIIPEVIEVDMGKSLERKSLMLNEIQTGDMVYFRMIVEGMGGDYMYPEFEDEPLIGYIVGIKTEGTALLGCCEFEEASMEEPIIYILEYKEVNGTLLPTSCLCVNCFDEFVFEGKYGMEGKQIKLPSIKESELDLNIPTENKPDGNVEVATNAEEAEKDDGNVAVIEALEEEKKESEKMLSDMITINEKLLSENASLKSAMNKIRKTKSTIGFTFQGDDTMPESKIGNIVKMMRK